jgi:predicted dehydrogenase
MFHAPAIAAGPETELAAVWARRLDAATALATAHGAQPVASHDDLLDACDAVAFAVPPDVQAEMAVAAARRGRSLLLDKPIAADLAAAERLADEVATAGVGSIVLFTLRYCGDIITFVDAARARRWESAEHWNISDGFLSGPFSHSPWRHERGAVLDIGPHAFDLLDAVCGPIVDVRATERDGLVTVECEHASGTRSVARVSGTATSGLGGGIELRAGAYGGEDLTLDLRSVSDAEAPANVRRALVDAAAGRGSELGVDRGLMVQRLVARCEAQLAG